MVSKSILQALISAVLVSVAHAGNERLCSIPPITYAGAKRTYPQAAFALTELESRGIATWYSDREANGDYAETAKQLVAQCGEDTRLTVVVYGLPNKDCEAGYSSVGSRVKTASDYEQFIGTLASIIGQRKVLYVLEPDAVGLLAKTSGGCAAQSGYLPNLQTAVKTLSANPNAEIYADVGYWVLSNPQETSAVASIIRQLGSSGRVKGITLNTSNYRSNGELSQLCGNFQSAIGNYDMRCIIDTSRNYHGPSAQNEWCNLRSAGIGQPPTGNTGLSNIDYFVWIKPPGDSDGKCDSGRTSEAMPGPEAGEFFLDAFSSLWSQGFLVQQEKMPRVGEYTEPSTPVPTTAAPTTPAPTTETPSPSTADRAIQDDSKASSSASSTDADTQALWNALVEQALKENTTAPTTVAPTAPPSVPSVTTEMPGDAQTESSGATKPLDGGAIAVITILAAAVAALAIAAFLRVRRKRLAMESKSPRGSYVSMAV